MISALEHSVEIFGLSILLSEMTMEFRLFYILIDDNVMNELVDFND